MNYKNKESLKGTLFVNAGINSGCPFCRALNADIPKVGENVRILSDYMAGLIGEVIGDETCLPIRDSYIPMDEFSTTRVLSLRPGEIMLHVYGSEYLSILNIKDDLLEPEPFSLVPDWAPPISLQQAAELHWYVMNLCIDIFIDAKCKYRNHASLPLIAHILKNRLPIEATELWDILEAHGFLSKWKSSLLKLYEDSKELLRIYHFMETGRNYRSKKRILPFSMESY